MSSAPTLTHHDWMSLALEEYQRIDKLLSGLSATDWDAPTDCTGWSVRHIVAHLAGSAAATASIREQLRQQRHGSRRKGDGLQLDAVNELHIRERAHLAPDDLRRELTTAAARGLRARTRMPSPLRALPLPFPPPLRVARLGYLTDVIYTRDAWMHRIDICRATETAALLTADHDGRIVADAAACWQHATGGADLVLTGPAGGRLTGARTATAPMTYDAVDFARALSGRCELPGIASDVVLF